MLDELVSRAASLHPEAVAVRAPDGDLTYGELDRAANRVARALAAMGIGPGDRVGLWLAKSAQTIIAMQAVLRLGAAYVPVDPTSPATRAHIILAGCAVKVLVARTDSAQLVLTGDLEGVPHLAADTGLAWNEVAARSGEPLARPSITKDDLAYILYTSGSTGQPKGVCISHENALAFVMWAVDTFGAHPSDRFSSHAPFHFDLSVLDLYAAFAVGAAVCLVPESTAYVAEALVDFIRDERITIWYSAPSAILLMMDHAALLEQAPSSLRTLLFAGEPFPVKHLRKLLEAWPGVSMWNLYGPTETNVCTAYHVLHLEAHQASVPIGGVVCGNRAWVKKEDGQEAHVGEEGELMIEGPTVFLGYWGKPPQARSGYGTGDIVRLGADGNYQFLGRRDHMVKVRGHRIELGEVEAALVQHPAVRESVAVVFGEGLKARLIAYIGIGSSAVPTLLELKRHCAERLPRYMIPDDVRSMPALPRNSNGKIQRQSLG